MKQRREKEKNSTDCYSDFMRKGEKSRLHFIPLTDAGKDIDNGLIVSLSAQLFILFVKLRCFTSYIQIHFREILKGNTQEAISRHAVNIRCVK